MEKNNGKGDKKRTMRKIIEAQMDHYSHLHNCAKRPGELTPTQRAQRASGTAGNEAQHRQLLKIGETVWRQRVGLLRSKLALYHLKIFSTRLFRTFYTTGRPEGLMAREIANFVKDLQVALHEETAEEREVRLKEEHEATQREAVYREKEKEKKARLRAGRGVVEEPEDFKGDEKRNKEEALTARICDTRALRSEAFRKMRGSQAKRANEATGGGRRGKGREKRHGAEVGVCRPFRQRGRQRKNHGEGQEDRKNPPAGEEDL